jgi:hypothetical protein
MLFAAAYVQGSGVGGGVGGVEGWLDPQDEGNGGLDDAA